jgi:hypothetical protein
MPNHVCRFVHASFGSQAILKEYFHSSCFCAPCFLEPDNQQWHSIRCYCMHAQRLLYKSHSISCRVMFADVKCMPVSVKPFSKNVFHRVVTWAQGVFEPDNRCGWQTFCRHTDTCLWIQVIRPVDNPWLLICICKLGNANPSERYFHSSCLLSNVCWTWWRDSVFQIVV